MGGCLFCGYEDHEVWFDCLNEELEIVYHWTWNAWAWV